MEQNLNADRNYLFLALIAGLSGCASFAALFYSAVPFSIFPLLTFGFSVYCFNKKQAEHPIGEGTPLIAFACFLVGVFGYSAFARMEAPEIGGNFFSIISCMALLIWLFFKTGWLSFELPKEKDEKS